MFQKTFRELSAILQLFCSIQMMLLIELLHTKPLKIFFLVYFIDIQLIYNAVLITAVQQNDTVTHIYVCVYIYIYIHTFFFILFSIMVYHRVLNIVSVLYSITLLFSHPIYKSLHLLTSTSILLLQLYHPSQSPVYSLYL